jgi:hypothetical protein
MPPRQTSYATVPAVAALGVQKNATCVLPTTAALSLERGGSAVVFTFDDAPDRFSAPSRTA